MEIGRSVSRTVTFFFLSFFSWKSGRSCHSHLGLIVRGFVPPKAPVLLEGTGLERTQKWPSREYTRDSLSRHPRTPTGWRSTTWTKFSDRKETGPGYHHPPPRPGTSAGEKTSDEKWLKGRTVGGSVLGTCLRQPLVHFTEHVPEDQSFTSWLYIRPRDPGVCGTRWRRHGRPKKVGRKVCPSERLMRHRHRWSGVKKR